MLVSIIVSQSSMSPSYSFSSPKASPALLISTSTAAHLPVSELTAVVAASRSRTSKTNG